MSVMRKSIVLWLSELYFFEMFHHKIYILTELRSWSASDVGYEYIGGREGRLDYASLGSHAAA